MNLTYTVKPGDTLYGISNQYGVSVTELADLNNVKANTLRVGQVLNIPPNSGTNPNNMFMYTVKKGDSLYSIASKYNTTVGKIVDLNNLKNTNLQIGDILRIPEKYTEDEKMILPNFTNYVVKKGDSLYSIAKNNGVSVDDIMKDNGLTNLNLQIGTNLKIRTKNNLTNIEECINEEIKDIDDGSVTTYVVKKGDSLYTIANKYNTSVDKIKSLNNLTSNSLSVNQVLQIPGSNASNQGAKYVVKKGENLYSIARKFNTSVDSIKRKNNLKNNVLSIGQTLII